MAQEQLVSVAGKGSVADIADRLEAALAARGITLFARVDHAAGAAAAGLTLRPTILLVFGDAKVGTALMQAEQTIGIDLPLKMLVWQDAAGSSWLTYADPAELARRNGLDPATQPTVAAMSKGLAALANAAGVP
jgi:uncharacterized protein (DUF302 family)